MLGILNVNKPKYATSRAAVNAVQYVCKPHKVGHAGTLDPIATGVLLICVGKATRLVSRIQNLPKVYRATFVFGETSNTDDCMGTVERTNLLAPTESDIRSALAQFTGDIDQVPPKFSAVHVDGRRAYKLARKGKAVELKPKSVRIDRFELLGATEKENEYVFEIECGSGTYIRALARDLGEVFGCGGLMSALQRTRIGEFSMDSGWQLTTNNEGQLRTTVESVTAALESPLSALPGVATRQCSESETTQIRQGRAIEYRNESKSTETALLNPEGRMIALAAFDTRVDKLQPRIVFDARQ